MYKDFFMNKILIIYSTIDWHTKKISEFLKDSLQSKGAETEVAFVLDEIPSIKNYEKIIIASSIRYWKYHKKIKEFVDKNFEELNNKKTAFIWVNLVARKPNKNTPETNIYTKKFLKNSPWEPNIVQVCAGCLDYSKYNWSDKLMIKLIMKITWWPTSWDKPIEYTNWEELKAFGEKFSEL